MKTRSISYREAVREAQQEEMRLDESVILYGIDVADHKGIFGSTVGLKDEFAQRVFSTPLCEDTLVGFGLGAAISGLRPINVHMRVDFLLLAMNQLANMVSNFHYGSGGKVKVPLVIRAIIGKGWGQAYQHSKSLQSYFAHLPGLKVVMPTTPADAKGLLISAIRDDNPVLVIEHRMLYDVVDVVDDKNKAVPLGKANVLRRGKDITIASTSYMNVEALQASEILRKQGVSVEVIDVRSIYPLDEKTIVNSVLKTKHLMIVDYDWVYCGFGAELAAVVGSKCFGILKSPIERLGFAAAPAPCTRPLENLFYPTAETIVRAVEKTLKLKSIDLSSEEFFTYENKFRGPF